jgi:putative oxidoreductase
LFDLPANIAGVVEAGASPQSAWRVTKMLTKTGDDRKGLARILIRMMDSAVAAIRWIARPSLAQFLLRLALAVPFWKLGIPKWSSFLQLNSTVVDSFAGELKLFLPGGPYNIPAPATMAFIFGCAEVIFPVLLVLGLGTRPAATGLLLVAYTVELTMPGDWAVEITWVAMALGLMAWGPGRLSLDYMFRSALRRAAKTDCVASL